jgi:hypothetical protein
MSQQARHKPASDPRSPGVPGPRRITRLLTHSEEYPLAQASRLSSRFRLEHPVEVHDFPEKGNINQHTFLVFAGPSKPAEYLLQRINERVFTRPRSVMRAMIASIESQRASMAAGRLPPGDEWETITLVDTCDGLPYLEVENHRGYSCWRLMVKIPESRTYKSLGEIPDAAERLRVAGEAGRGLAIYGDFTCRMRTDDLENPLPGYRDTCLYYDQLRSILAGHRTPGQAGGLLPADPTVRHSTEEHFLVHLEGPEYRRRMDDPEFRPWIDLVRSEETFGVTLLEGMKSGRIRRLAIHGDTKLDNFLFSTRTGRVKALVDLDTIMPHSWLRFLTDYLRGDSYFRLGPADPPDLNRVRAMVQLALFRQLRERADEARRFVEDLRAEFPAAPRRRLPAPGTEPEPDRGSPDVGEREA